MASILITGSNGQLGSEIKALASSEIHSFYFTDYKELDITDNTAIETFMHKKSIDFVINCAAYTAVDKAEKDKENAHKINALAPSLLANACVINNSHFIHISTDYVFDGTINKPITEKDKENPQSVYGTTKLEGEQLVIQKKPDSIIIRTSWLYSSFGNNFVKTMIKLGQEKDTLGVVADQYGTPTYARDLAKHILQIINTISLSTSTLLPGIYHYSNIGECTWYDFAKEIHRLKNITCNVKPVTTAEYPTPAKRPQYSVLDKTKIIETYNLTIPEWKESLQDCIAKL